MKGVLGNSCAKGCLVYVIALVIIVAVTAFGLGGLKAKFGASSQGTPTSAQTNGSAPPSFSISSSSTQQPAYQQAPGSGASASASAGGNPNDSITGSYFPTPTSVPAQPIPPSQPNAPVASPAEGSTPEVIPQVFTPVESQGGVISGEASAPFYVVQSGDTLWDISRRFGVDTEALRVINNLSDNIIYPGQTLTLAQGGMSQQATGEQPAPQGTTPQPAVPGVPAPGATGVAGPVGATGTELPNMPDTGINRKP